MCPVASLSQPSGERQKHPTQSLPSCWVPKTNSFPLARLYMNNWPLQSLLTEIKLFHGEHPPKSYLLPLAFWLVFPNSICALAWMPLFGKPAWCHFFGLLRKSLLLVNSPLSFDAFSHLLHSDSCSSLGSLGYYPVEQTQTIYGTGSLLTDSRKFPFTQLLLPIDRQIDRQTDRQTNR